MNILEENMYFKTFKWESNSASDNNSLLSHPQCFCTHKQQIDWMNELYMWAYLPLYQMIH